MQREAPDLSYRDVMAVTLDRVAGDLPAGERDELARSLPGWPPFPEATAALALLPETVEQLVPS